jgi:hypothetical protein
MLLHSGPPLENRAPHHFCAQANVADLNVAGCIRVPAVAHFVCRLNNCSGKPPVQMESKPGTALMLSSQKENALAVGRFASPDD